MPSVLLFGATGLVGGMCTEHKYVTGADPSLKARLAAAIKKAHPDWPLTAFYRNRSADDYFKETVRANRIVHGDFSQKDLVRSLSKDHDIVINAASSFDGDFVETIISGMEERPENSKGTLVHLSGTGNFIDFGTTGNFNPGSKIWNVSLLNSMNRKELAQTKTG